MKKAWAIALFMMMLVVSGCQQIGIPGRRKEEQPSYRTGSQGIVINFLPNYPRPTMYDDEPFSAMLEVRNRGSYNVGFAGDRIYLSGFDTKIITGISNTGQQIRPLEGASQFNPDGGYDTIEFSGEIYPLKMKNVDRYPATILATTCYNYKTIASENICIDPNPFSATAERKVCAPGTVSYGTQGAPIAVSSVQVEATPRITRFKISIDNVGGGAVYKAGAEYVAKCSPYHPRGLEYNEVDTIRLSGVEVVGKSITPSCKPVNQKDSTIKLINGHATIFCELGGLGSGPAYTSPLTVELDYGYRTTISKSVEIIQTPG